MSETKTTKTFTLNETGEAIMRELEQTYWVCSCGLRNHVIRRRCFNCGSNQPAAPVLSVSAFREALETRFEENGCCPMCLNCREGHVDWIVARFAEARGSEDR